MQSTRESLDRASTSSDEVHDQRDHSKEQKQMNEQARAFKHYEPTEPQHDQNHCENQEHWITLLSSFKGVARRARELLVVRDTMGSERCLPKENICGITRPADSASTQVVQLSRASRARRRDAYSIDYPFGLDVRLVSHVAA
jgi:hypothetical protein